MQLFAPADTWEDIEIFGDAKYEWFKEFLELENRIPSQFLSILVRLPWIDP